MSLPSRLRGSPSLVRTLYASVLALILPACSAEELKASAASIPPSESLAVSAEELRSRVALFSLRPLSEEPVPQPIGGHIIDQEAAILLGKAFFWDMQAGSDGQTACASCHYAAGADDRRTNTVHPGLDGVFNSGGVTGPGQTFNPSIITSDDRIGSQGMFRALFQTVSTNPAVAAEQCRNLPAQPFLTHRQVGFRHSPSVIGSVFYRHQFWGGEANHVFNGLSIWGNTGNNTGGAITQVMNASLASQAVGPPTNFTEMTCFGRPLNGPTNSLAQKLLARTPLQFQRVAVNDSVLGALANPTGPGLRCNGAPCTYQELIRNAFGEEIAANALTVFSLIWGEALQAYQATLVPDKTPLDSFLLGNFSALTTRQQNGLIQFVNHGCINCHNGAMLSDATVSAHANLGPLNRDGGDIGFHNIGVRPTDEDLARGDLGIFGGVPNSESGSPFDLGAFKTPTLRNVKLTAPYFHTGGYPTLAAVVDFYARGGDFANPERSKDIVPLTIAQADRDALVDFLTNALTDCRVEKKRAPFDHPELPIPNRDPLPAVGANGLGFCP